MPLFIFVTRFFAPILISPSCKVALSNNFNMLRAKKGIAIVQLLFESRAI